MTRSEAAVDLSGISKRFGDLSVIRNATLAIERGEIHALVGENGAGKSTLMNILYGLIARDAGEIRVNGTAVAFRRPAEAIRAGIGMVHQHIRLGASFTVAENIVAGHEPMRSFGRFDRARAERESAALSQRFGLDLDPTAIVATLPVGLRQRVEILKTLYRSAQILVLDEPTAVLTPTETAELFATMRRLTGSGCSVIFITHKLREVLDVADRISVMRRGEIVATMRNHEVSGREIAALMIGRQLQPLRPGRATVSTGQPALRVDRLVAFGERGEVAVDGLSLTLSGGEIVGLAGVQGNGQDELVQCLVGLRQAVSGRIEVCGRPATGGPRERRDAGIAYIPADRGGLGLSLDSSIWENVSVGHFPSLRRGLVLDVARARRRAASLIEEHDIRGANPDKPARSLSGGNAQKVQIARELSRQVGIVIAEQPSQGVDVGALESIYRILVTMRDAGCAVLVVSSDLDEIMLLCDRILVIYRGGIVADLPRDATTLEEIGQFVGGIREQDHPPVPGWTASGGGMERG